MELHEIETVGFQVGEAALDEGGDVFAVVACGDVGIEAAACFGGHDDFFTGTFFFEAGDEAFRTAVAINVGGVEEVDAQIDGFVQGCHGGGFIDVAPIGADGPRAKADG